LFLSLGLGAPLSLFVIVIFFVFVFDFQLLFGICDLRFATSGLAIGNLLASGWDICWDSGWTGAGESYDPRFVFCEERPKPMV
jgi:hypothetical protein